MAESVFKKFKFYQEYLWSPADFEAFQAWVAARFEGVFEGSIGGAALSGLDVLINTGLSVLVNPGIGISPSGVVMVVPTQQTTSVSSPVGNPAKTLIVLRPKTVLEDFINEPLVPSNMVPLHERLTWEIVVLNGTPSPTPSYPATQAGDIVLMGVKLTSGQTTLAFSDFDFGVISRPKKKLRKVQAKTAQFTVSTEDDISEMDCTATGVIGLLPPLQESQGKQFVFIKTDAGANAATVSGAEQIDGFSSIDLPSQNDKITVVGCPTMWRTL